MPHPLPTWLNKQDGRLAVITGANSGIGLEAARMLAGAGATVVLACRRPDAAAAAMADIRQTHPDAALETVQVDLADLSSIAAATESIRSRQGSTIDHLINNAGVFAPPTRRITTDGFELQLGVNHFGHFAWTMQLFSALSKRARIVQVSSIAHRAARMDWSDLHSARRYHSWLAYGRSKLANLLFVAELHRRLEDRSSKVRAVACHPGYTDTKLQTALDTHAGLFHHTKRLGNYLLAQSPAAGAEPTVYAAVSPYVQGGDYVGPSRFFEFWGPPVKVRRSARARSQADQQRLWDVSVEATGLDLS
ncbi:MAG: hypothetical protein CL927_05085 [Deltaproteobacteria bacterium]|nr:hypothetical protein [Deltaproteobacteria bacterium]HCH64788.1 hypothetical protein [Deltaproteobacteria bacterium]